MYTMIGGDNYGKEIDDGIVQHYVDVDHVFCDKARCESGDAV